MIKASGAQVLTRYPVASREAALVVMVPGILRTNRRNVVWPQSLPQGPCSARAGERREFIPLQFLSELERGGSGQ